MSGGVCVECHVWKKRRGIARVDGGERATSNLAAFAAVVLNLASASLLPGGDDDKAAVVLVAAPKYTTHTNATTSTISATSNIAGNKTLGGVSGDMLGFSFTVTIEMQLVAAGGRLDLVVHGCFNAGGS